MTTPDVRAFYNSTRHRTPRLAQTRSAHPLLRPTRPPQPQRPLTLLLDQPRLRRLELPRLRRPRRRLRRRPRRRPRTTRRNGAPDRQRARRAAATRSHPLPSDARSQTSESGPIRSRPAPTSCRRDRRTVVGRSARRKQSPDQTTDPRARLGAPSYPSTPDRVRRRADHDPHSKRARGPPRRPPLRPVRPTRPENTSRHRYPTRAHPSPGQRALR